MWRSMVNWREAWAPEQLRQAGRGWSRRNANNGGEGGAAVAAHLDEDLHRGEGEGGEEGEEEGALKRSGMCSVQLRLCRTQRGEQIVPIRPTGAGEQE